MTAITSERLASPSFHKVAFVTGASSGIGRATALAFARAGAAVTFADIDEAGSAETSRLIAEAGRSALPRPAT